MQWSGKKSDVRIGEWRVLFPCQSNKTGQLSSIHFPHWRATLSEECSLGAHSHSVSALEGNCSGNTPQARFVTKITAVWKIGIFVQPSSLAVWFSMALPRVTNHSATPTVFPWKNEITGTLTSQELLYEWIGNKGRKHSEPCTELFL